MPLLFNRNAAKTSKTELAHAFPAKVEPLLPLLSKRFTEIVVEHWTLFDATCVALSVHVLAFPLFWFLGFALPWPKAPEVTTIIEYDLTNWPEVAVPDKVTDIYKSYMHKFKPGE